VLFYVLERLLARRIRVHRGYTPSPVFQTVEN